MSAKLGTGRRQKGEKICGIEILRQKKIAIMRGQNVKKKSNGENKH